MAVAAKPVVAGKGYVRVDIERLVTWSLRDQGLGWSGTDSFSAIAQMATLGTTVDTSSSGSHPSIGLWTSDDAMHVKSAVDGLPGAARALVWRYGRAALRPEWGEEGEGAWEQDADAAGRPRWDWDDPVNRTGNRRPHMVFVGTDPDVIEAERAEYALWWQGLADIVAPLNRVMSEHIATGPAAPAQPWAVARPVEHGVGPKLEVKRAPKERLAGDLRREAQDMVRSRATDWSVPLVEKRPKESRRKRRTRRAS